MHPRSTTGFDSDLSIFIGEFVSVLDQVNYDLFESSLVANEALGQLVVTVARQAHVALLLRHAQAGPRAEDDVDALALGLRLEQVADKVERLLRVELRLIELKHALLYHVQVEHILCEGLHEVKLTDNDIAELEGALRGMPLPVHLLYYCEQLLGKHDHRLDWRPHFVIYRRLVTLCLLLRLLELAFLEPSYFFADLVGHILECEDDGWPTLVAQFLLANAHEEAVQLLLLTLPLLKVSNTELCKVDLESFFVREVLADHFC
mmetsp:Transcript_36077/g.47427  ORF Transcript_36077/g.47427 Transcript_36077/m.47427 type:complete len:262 (+) Transcript_36077:1121-1906(+)